jgi:hypothetical protein
MMMKLHAHGDDDVESRGELIAKKNSTRREGVRRTVTEDDTGSGHHAAQRALDLPYLARQLSRGETWQIRKGATKAVVG